MTVQLETQRFSGRPDGREVESRGLTKYVVQVTKVTMNRSPYPYHTDVTEPVYYKKLHFFVVSYFMVHIHTFKTLFCIYIGTFTGTRSEDNGFRQRLLFRLLFPYDTEVIRSF